MEATVIPLPMELTTPPVTNMYLVMYFSQTVINVASRNQRIANSYNTANLRLRERNLGEMETPRPENSRWSPVVARNDNTYPFWVDEIQAQF